MLAPLDEIHCKLLYELPVVLIVTRRDSEAELDSDVARILGDLEWEATLVALHHFDLQETSVFLAVQDLRQPGTDVLLAVLRVTGGHPLSLRRLVALGPPDPERALPAGLCSAISEAARRLLPSVRRIRETSAALGVSPAVTEAAAVASTSVSAVLDAAGQAARAGSVDHVGIDSFTFSHDLVRETLTDALTPTARLDAHARAAAVLDVTLPATALIRWPVARTTQCMPRPVRRRMRP